MPTTVVTEKKKISVYLDPELKPLAEKLAKARNRSLSNLCESLLRDAVNNALNGGELDKDS